MSGIRVVKKYLILTLILLGVQSVYAQNSNPFEIKRRLEGSTDLSINQIDTNNIPKPVDSITEPPKGEEVAGNLDNLQETPDTPPPTSTEILADSGLLPQVEIDSSIFFYLYPVLPEDNEYIVSADSNVQNRPANGPENADSIAEKSRTDSASLFNQIRKQFDNQGILNDQKLILIFSIFLMICLSSLLGLFRGNVAKAYRAITNDNYLRFLIREYQNSSWVYWLFYFFFFFNFAFFVFLIGKDHIAFFKNPFLFLGSLIIMVFVAYIIKHLLLYFLGYIFPIDKETFVYSFMMMLVNCLLGLILFPINLLLSFGPENLFNLWFWIGIAAIIFMYFYRQLKGLFISASFLQYNKMHFFLYLCIVEIAPILLIGKLLMEKIYF